MYKPLDLWIPLTPVEKMAETDYDVLIVGTGAGGGAVLYRLCERLGRSGKRIGVVEAGDLELPTHAFNVPTLNEDRAVAYWERIADPAGLRWPDFPGAKMVKALGGRTLLWYNFSPRFNPADFRTWPISYKDIAPYYLIAEKLMSITPFYSEGSALQKTLLQRLVLGGFPEATDLPIAADLEQTQYGQVHSNVFFSSIIFLVYALNSGRFDLAVNTRAVRIVTEKGTAAGVQVKTPDMKTYTLRARTVVLSASTWETPRLLLYSNIPGEAIGKYLVNHSQYSALASANRDQFPEVLGTATILLPEQEYAIVAFSDFIYKYTERPLQRLKQLRVRGYGVVEPRAENYVSLDPARRDAYGVPMLNVHFSYSAKDWAIIREIADVLPNFISAMGLSVDAQPQLEPPGIDNHEAGTCRMGDSPATSATNRYGQIHGIPGLYVADNSVLNLTSPANPTLTTVALAIRTADHIVSLINLEGGLS